MPGTGDDVQALKAGIMEIADIFVVNKADREGADRLVVVDRIEPVAAGVRARRVAAADREDRGDDRRRRAPSCRRRSTRFASTPAGDGARRRRARSEFRLRELVAQRFMEHLERDACSTPASSTTIVERIAARELDPYTARR